MSLRRLTNRQKKIADYYGLLSSISRLQLPHVCLIPNQIEQLLALHSAGLLTAHFDPQIIKPSGERHIPRAVVTGITPEGKLVVNRAAQATMREIDLPGRGMAMSGKAAA